MLERMHAVRNRKATTKLQKKEAQAKAKEQIKKIKQRHAMIAAILSQRDDLEEQHPYIPSK